MSGKRPPAATGGVENTVLSPAPAVAGRLSHIVILMLNMSHFNFTPVAKEAGIPPDKLRELCAVIRRDFPADDMLYELHVLRACMAVRDGLIGLDDVLQTESEPRAV